MSLDCNHILDRILKQCVAIATHKKMNGIATRSLIIQGSASAMHHLRNNHQNEGVFLLYASHMCLCIGNMYIVRTGLLQLLGYVLNT